MNGFPPGAKVVLDANVLVPINLTNFLLRCADRKLFSPAWSDAILDEALAAAAILNGKDKEFAIRRRFAQMNSAFPLANIPQVTQDVPIFGLPDDGDEHVLRTAVQAHALIITTENVKDFPDRIPSPHRITAMNVDDFSMLLYRLDKLAIMDVFVRLLRAYKNPPITGEDLLDSLDKEGMKQLVAALREEM